MGNFKDQVCGGGISRADPVSGNVRVILVSYGLIFHWSTAELSCILNLVF